MEDEDKKNKDLNKDKKPGDDGSGDDGGDNKDKKSDDAGFKQKLEGKDNAQLIEMYGNLERKVGEMSGEEKVILFTKKRVAIWSRWGLLVVPKKPKDI